MVRKLIFLGALLLVTAWSSSVDAIGNCSCTFCRPGSTANCLEDGAVVSCADFRLSSC